MPNTDKRPPHIFGSVAARDSRLLHTGGRDFRPVRITARESARQLGSFTRRQWLAAGAGALTAALLTGLPTDIVPLRPLPAGGDVHPLVLSSRPESLYCSIVERLTTTVRQTPHIRDSPTALVRPPRADLVELLPVTNAFGTQAPNPHR